MKMFQSKKTSNVANIITKATVSIAGNPRKID